MHEQPGISRRTARLEWPAAAFASLAFAVPAQGAEIAQMLGRWSVPEYDQCGEADDGDGAPLSVALADGEYHIGNYGWGCTVKIWTKAGAFLKGQSTCSNEGEDDASPGVLELGLTNSDQLLVMQDENINSYRRCPAAK